MPAFFTAQYNTLFYFFDPFSIMILLQINFHLPAEMMGEALVQSARALAESINHEPGFISKFWIENQQTEESGGIYLFQDEATAQQYAQMHVERVKAMGATEIECKYFNVNMPLSKINHAVP
ncbi:Putative monooxygenase YdhR [Saezia sanguinis]|uniref:Monooxygenase YdhR n=1 Tax=Saezia sanguinis TaxID=1965230 RepID=A0A433S9Z9_9BURK|nr:monooxygenase [Saezia sanguinis]RUS65566.1 Putative monooxygenase YdhR [Saezia sanguinis]